MLCVVGDDENRIRLARGPELRLDDTELLLTARLPLQTTKIAAPHRPLEWDDAALDESDRAGEALKGYNGALGRAREQAALLRGHNAWLCEELRRATALPPKTHASEQQTPVVVDTPQPVNASARSRRRFLRQAQPAAGPTPPPSPAWEPAQMLPVHDLALLLHEIEQQHVQFRADARPYFEFPSTPAARDQESPKRQRREPLVKALLGLPSLETLVQRSAAGHRTFDELFRQSPSTVAWDDGQRPLQTTFDAAMDRLAAASLRLDARLAELRSERVAAAASSFAANR